VLLVALAFWIYAVQRLLRFAGDAGLRDGRSASALSGLLVLVPTGVALVALHRSGEAGPGLVLLLLVLVWAADSGAYFAGKRWGRRKLAPTVSPGKTVEGVCGGLTLAMVAAISGWYVLQPGTLALGPAIAISLATVVFSIVGDLYESMLKRQHSVKDSGTLLPGHGGMLDRIDSLTAASPVFALGVLGAGS
jgi:phosphatidate cytidylyltransferase